jgi:DNA invertase Pin-like site-specific DNA recombinase
LAIGKFIAYFRVSTERQGRYLDGGRWELVAEFTEVESGKRNDRRELARALAACRLHHATLLIAKIDRLSRRSCSTFGMLELISSRLICPTPIV